MRSGLKPKNSYPKLEMLGLNYKRSDQVDLVIPIREFIASNHSKEDAKKLEDAIQAVNRTRQNAVGALERASSVDYQTALNACAAYLSTFSMLTHRFPWGDHKRETFLGFKTGKSEYRTPPPPHDTI